MQIVRKFAVGLSTFTLIVDRKLPIWEHNRKTYNRMITMDNDNVSS